MKDRQKTEQDILKSVDDLIQRKGFSSLGVNAIAREAGVSKVLIYRYFGDFDGLMKSWARANSYWSEKEFSFSGDETPSELAKKVFRGYSQSINDDRIKREMLRWQIALDSPVGQLMMENSEDHGMALTEKYKEMAGSQNIDVDALFAFLTAGLSYLTLMKDRADVFNGIHINDELDWARIEVLVDRIIDSL